MSEPDSKCSDLFGYWFWGGIVQPYPGLRGVFKFPGSFRWVCLKRSHWNGISWYPKIGPFHPNSYLPNHPNLCFLILLIANHVNVKVVPCWVCKVYNKKTNNFNGLFKFLYILENAISYFKLAFLYWVFVYFFVDKYS